MNSKQTDNNEQKKKVPEDWSLESAVDGKTKSAKSASQSVEAKFQEMIANGIIGGGNPNHSLTTKDIADTPETEDSIESEDRTNTKNSLQTESADVPHSPTPKRISSKQRKESLEEYKETFLQIPKLEDRKPVFISCEVRDSLGEIVRKLGGRRMSVSGFIENLARHHLEVYHDDVEIWKKL